jgi:hypothetical protein
MSLLMVKLMVADVGDRSGKGKVIVEITDVF